MASKGYYAYYIRGNQLALIEHDNVSGDGQTLDQPSLDDIGPGGGLQWKSPIAAVAGGIEIEYAYSPRYTLPGIAPIDGSEPSKRYINGWTAEWNSTNEKSYLALLRSAGASQSPTNWTSINPAVGDYIVIGGNSRWNGLHKVRDKGSALLTLETEVSNEAVRSSDVILGSGSQFDFETDDNSVFDGGGGNIFLGDHFFAGDYVWITGCSNNNNNGLFSVSSVETSATAASSKIILGTRYGTVTAGVSATLGTGLSNEFSAAATIADDADQSDIVIRRAYRDFSYIIFPVDVLNDEADTIDLPEYLAKGLVYYVKAKMAEDAMDLERKEYFMREFRRILEKHESSKIWGARMITAGPASIR